MVSDRDGDTGLFLLGGGRAEPERLSAASQPGAAIVDLFPAWSHDGAWIAHHRLTPDGRDSLLVIEIESGDAAASVDIGPPAIAQSAPSWSPYGTRVAYWSTGDASNEIRVLDVRTGMTTNLTNDPAADRYPAWSRMATASPSGPIGPTRASCGSWRPTARRRGRSSRSERLRPGRLVARRRQPDRRGTARFERLRDRGRRRERHHAGRAADRGQHGQPRLVSRRRSYCLLGSAGPGARAHSERRVRDQHQEARSAGTDARRFSTRQSFEHAVACASAWSPHDDQLAVEWPRTNGTSGVLLVAIESNEWRFLTDSAAAESSPAWQPGQP
jgi:hypothetical protein